MALNCIKNVLHSCRSLISGALLALPLLTGCSGDSEILDLADASDKLSSEAGNYITLDLSVGVNNGMGPGTRTFIPGDNHPFEGPSSEYEKVHTLR
ncbi:MAG: hypothetical protein K2H75_03960, partial [Muribaculaceae bacterium]|nr:hypothetical protein [Muribaculaceae bacterium]